MIDATERKLMVDWTAASREGQVRSGSISQRPAGPGGTAIAREEKPMIRETVNMNADLRPNHPAPALLAVAALYDEFGRAIMLTSESALDQNVGTAP